MATASLPDRTPPLASARVARDDGRLCVHIPRGAGTLAGFRAWVKADDFPEHVRVTFVDGEIIYDMSNEELETHNKVKCEVLRVLMNLNRKLKLGTYYGDGVLISNKAGKVSNNPDGTFVCAASLRSQRVRLVSRQGTEGHYIEIEGTPDCVIEIVSKYSVRKDTKLLRGAYHRAGIPEYWLIDARREEISFQILHWREDDYESVAGRGGWQRSAVFGREFRLIRQRNDLGLWDYTLQVRTPASGRKRKR